MFSFCSWFSLRFVDIVVLRGDRGWAGGGGGTPHMKGVGMLVGNFELNP